MANLTSRERVERALNHQEVDRIPADLGSTVFTTIHLEVAKELNRLLGIKQDNYQFVSFSAQVVKPNAEIMKRFNIDTYGVSSRPSSSFKLVVNEDDSYVDEWGIEYKRVPGSYQYDFVSHPLEQAGINDIDEYRWPDPVDEGRFQGLLEEVQHLYTETDYAIVLNPPYGGQIMALSAWLTGFEKHYMDMGMDHDFVRALSDRLLEWHCAWLDKALTQVGDYISVVALADDLGIQTGPMISPRMYRDLYKEYHRKLISFIKARTNAKVFWHSCGSVTQFLPDLIEIGVDILNPVQVSATDMDTAFLKSEFGDKLSFWGGACNSQSVLPFGTEEEVAQEVERRIKDLKPGGGFVFAPIHNIVPGVSARKVQILYEAVEKFGRY